MGRLWLGCLQWPWLWFGLTSQSWRFRLSRLSSSVNLIAIFRHVIAKSLISRFLILRAPMVRSSSENAKQKVSNDNWSDWLKSVLGTGSRFSPEKIDSKFSQKKADSKFSTEKDRFEVFFRERRIQRFFQKVWKWILRKKIWNELTQVWEYMYIHHPYPAGWRIPVLRDHFEFVNSILDRR